MDTLDTHRSSRSNGEHWVWGPLPRRGLHEPLPAVPGAKRVESKYRKAMPQKTAQAADVHAEDAKEAAPRDAVTSAETKGISVHLDNAIEEANAQLRKHPALAPEIGPLREQLENFKKILDQDKPAAHGTGGNSGGAPIPGQFPRQTTDPADYMAHSKNRQDQLHEQQMAMQDANMTQQLMMNSFQQFSQTVTAFSQAQTANTSALCNTLLDCIKAINELLKKGGSMQSGAIGH